jgi:hypothetical protein
VAARNADVPRYAYMLAVVVGFFGLTFIFAAAYLAGDLIGYLAAESPDRYYGDVESAAITFVLSHAALGAVFGLLWPEKSWRWGVWLCSMPGLLATFLAPSALAFLMWEALTLLPACVGAFTAGRLHLKFTAIDESG